MSAPGTAAMFERWLGGAAQVTGRSHMAAGTPCQDHAGCLTRNGVFALALADGAGSRRLSHLGARAAVDAALRLATSAFDELWSASDGVCARRILSAVLERIRRMARRNRSDPERFASTLALAAVREGRLLVAHLGDGAVIGIGESGPALLTAPDNGEHASETWFTTTEGAARRLRIVRDADRKWRAILLASDGTASSLVQKRTGRVAQAASTLAGWGAEAVPADFSALLERNLATVIGPRTSDDVSLAVGVRMRIAPAELLARGEAYRRMFLGTGDDRACERRFSSLLDPEGAKPRIPHRSIRRYLRSFRRLGLRLSTVAPAKNEEGGA